MALLVREPCALVPLHGEAFGEGQVLAAQILALATPIILVSMYRHASDRDFQLLQQLSDFLEAHNGSHWVVGLDAKASMNQGPVVDMFHYHSAHCGAQARHTTEPIDGIWLSTALGLVAGGELPSPSDHTIATVTLNLKVQAVPGHRWRLTQVRKLDHTAPKPEGAGRWTQVATSDDEWRQAKQNVDQAWDVWSRDAEKWLIQQKQLTSRQPERLLGTIPKAVTLAPQESTEIRQLRRHLRRLDEVLFLTRRGREVPVTLSQAVRRHPQLTASEKRALATGAFGTAKRLAQDRLAISTSAHQRSYCSLESQGSHHSWSRFFAPPRICDPLCDPAC